MEALVIAYGEGRNGKSTFWNVIARVLGTYSGNISADMLTVGCRRNVKPELAEAKGKRMLIAAELEEGMRLNTANVKQLCSTDEIYAEKKYKDPFSYPLDLHRKIRYSGICLGIFVNSFSFVGFYTEEGVKNKGLLPSLFSMATIVALVGAICVLLFVFNELWPDKAKTKIVYLKVPSATIFSDIASEKMMYPALIL